MSRKVIMFFIAGWLLAVVLPPRELLARIKG